MKRISAALASGDGERAGRAMRDQLAAARQALQGAGNPAINRTRRASALA
jgi:DNA-binding GntR family transcriptional regulator